MAPSTPAPIGSRMLPPHGVLYWVHERALGLIERSVWGLTGAQITHRLYPNGSTVNSGPAVLSYLSRWDLVEHDGQAAPWRITEKGFLALQISRAARERRRTRGLGVCEGNPVLTIRSFRKLQTLADNGGYLDGVSGKWAGVLIYFGLVEILRMKDPTRHGYLRRYVLTSLGWKALKTQPCLESHTYRTTGYRLTELRQAEDYGVVLTDMSEAEEVPDFRYDDLIEAIDAQASLKGWESWVSDKTAYVIQQYAINGADMESLAAEFGVSRQRIHQIYLRGLAELRRYYLSRTDPPPSEDCT